MNDTQARNGKGAKSSKSASPQATSAMNTVQGFTEETDSPYVTTDSEGVKFLPYDEAQWICETRYIRWYREMGRFYIYENGVWVDAKEALHVIYANRLKNALSKARLDTIMFHLAAIVPTIEYDQCSTDYVNFTNGMLNWRTMELLPHDPSYLSMVQIPHRWNPDAKCPRFDAFLMSIVPTDANGSPTVEDQVRIWQRIGYTLYNGNPHNKLFLNIGNGRNGKGVLQRVEETVYGKKNCTHFTPHALIASRFTATNLRGTIANLAGDIDATYIKNTGLLKNLSGDDTINCEFKFGETFDLRYKGKMTFSANRVPTFSDNSDGFGQRWELFPFPNTFTGKDQNHNLTAELTSEEEIEGIIVGAIDGLKELMEREGRFMVSKASTEAKEEFLKASNPMKQWMETETQDSPGQKWNRSQAYNSYKTWCEDNKLMPISGPRFYAELRALKYDVDCMSHGTRYIVGLLARSN